MEKIEEGFAKTLSVAEGLNNINPMNKNITFALTIISLASRFSFAQLTEHQSGNIGIGVLEPTYKLDISNRAGELQNLFRIRVNGVTNDFFTIHNATGITGQFIPTVFGYHTTDNRQALYLTGSIGPGNDSGNEPIMMFDSRIENRPAVNRPLFGWDSYGMRRMTMSSTGNLGIGISNPWHRLQVYGLSTDSNGGILRIDGESSNANLRLGVNTNYAWIQSHGSRPLHINELGNNTILNAGTGSVGIGTLDPKGYKVAVAGKIIAEEVVVKLQGSWPDYVFDDEYKLPSLTEVASYIRKHKHLPEIPSQREVMANGISVGAMNALLLKKVEELTLYLIELKTVVEAQQKEIDQLKHK